MFEFHYLVLSNEDLCTLVTDNHWIESNVISVYAALLNIKEVLRDKLSPKKVFFGMDVMVRSFSFIFL